MRPGLLPLALACMLVLGSCTEDDDPCTGIYYTEDTIHHGSLRIEVEGPGLEPEWWGVRTSMWIYPSSGGYPEDEISLHISQTPCPDQRIIITGHVMGDGTFQDVTYASYWLAERCGFAAAARTFVPVSDGSITYHRTDEDVLIISFNNFRILNRGVGDPPDIESILINCIYQAPVDCLIVP